MLSFTPELAAMVLNGTKTQTRRVRVGRPFVPGSRHLCYTRPPWLKGKPFAEIDILKVTRERVGEISEADAVAEGFQNRAGFLGVIAEIYGREALEADCWCVEFRLHGRSSQSAVEEVEAAAGPT